MRIPSKPIFIMTIIAGFLLSFDIIFASGCEVEDGNFYWDESCTTEPEVWYYWQWSFNGGYGCAIGKHTTDYGHPEYPWSLGWYALIGKDVCVKSTEINELWKFMAKNQWPDGGIEGQVCIVKWDSFGRPCEEQWGGTSDYRWDPDDWGCVHCVREKQGEIHKCTDGRIDTAVYDCEEACGASLYCDELNPNLDLIKNCRDVDNLPYDGGTCDRAGETYFQDKCDVTCGAVDKDNICRSSGSLCTNREDTIDGCTADSECDDRVAGENWVEENVRKVCNSSCEYYETFIEDLNADKAVNIVDITIVARAFGTRQEVFGAKGGNDRWNPVADVNEDGVINIIDIAIIAKAFGSRLE